MTRIYYFACFFLLLSCILLTEGGFLRETRAAQGDDASGQSLTITLPANPFPPYYIMPESQELEVDGTAVTAIRALVERYNQTYADSLELTIIPDLPFARCLHMMQTGAGDIIGALYYSHERAEYMHLLPYVLDSRKSFLVRTDGPDVSGYEDLLNLRIGVHADYLYFQRFDKDERLKKFKAYSHKELINLLLNGRLDAVVMDDYLLQNILRENPDLHERLQPSSWMYVDDRPIHIGISKASPLGEQPRFERIKALATQMYEKGEFKAIIDDFFSRRFQQ